MSDNFFVQHPQIMRYIMQHEAQAANPIPIMYRAHDPILHTEEHPFCDDESCPCHRDFMALWNLKADQLEGLLTREEAIRLYRGQQL